MEDGKNLAYFTINNPKIYLVQLTLDKGLKIKITLKKDTTDTKTNKTVNENSKEIKLGIVIKDSFNESNMPQNVEINFGSQGHDLKFKKNSVNSVLIGSYSPDLELKYDSASKEKNPEKLIINLKLK